MSGQAHWDAAYGARATEDLGWYEPVPATLDLVHEHSGPTCRVIDVGGGVSGLARELMASGYERVTVLDVSEEAFERSREGRRFPICRPDALAAAFSDAGFSNIASASIEIDTHFASFDDYWNPLLTGQGSAPTNVGSLTRPDRQELQ